MASIVALLLVPLVPFVAHQLYHLLQNYRLARRTTLPIVLLPLHPFSLPWMLLSKLVLRPLLRPIKYFRVFDPTWSWEDNAQAHERMGETFVLVSPRKNVVYSSDVVAVEATLRRWKDFVKTDAYASMNMFGANLDTVNGEDWSRHRKLTAPCFNERVSTLVWSETLKQTRAMVAVWLSAPHGRVSNMVDDTRIVALHVLYSAGFGISADFHGGARDVAPGHQLSLKDALMTVVNNLVMSIIMKTNQKFFEKWRRLLGVKVNSVLLALREFQQYTDEAIVSERAIQAANPGETKTNLISTLIRTSDAASVDGVKFAARLSDDEIRGNIFIFNLAGHDTTANTLAYAFALLAVEPEIQDWILEEIDEVIGGRTDDAWKYEDVWPRLKRTMALMYETLRLYSPVPHLPRGTVQPGVQLPITNPDPATRSETPTVNITIPANTEIELRLHAMMTSAHNFPNPSTWNPRRWITPPPMASAPSRPTVRQILEEERLIKPPPSFAPWTSGPRVCPGMKFAQVEFAAALATVLKSLRVDAPGEGKAGREALRALVRKSGIFGATLSMERPEEVGIIVTKR